MAGVVPLAGAVGVGIRSYVRAHATILSLVALLATAATPMQSPSPIPTPLKVIGHVRSSLLCTTLRDNIFHTIEGLRVNDLLITQGTSTLTKMSQDAVTGSRASKLNLQRRGSGNAVANSALEMDNFHLSQTVNAIAKNLEKLDDFLSDKNRFAKTPKNDDEAALDDAKKALESIASQQRSALNILSGTMGTTALQGLLARGDNTNGALQQASQPGTSVDLQNPIVGGSEPTQTNPSNTSTTAGANSAAGANSTATTASLFARNSFGQLALATLIQQKFITASENAAVAEISPIINACH